MAWTILGESVTGTSHCARDMPCQDAFRVRTFGAHDEWLVIAAADGAGSASHSQIGASLACDEIVQRVAVSELGISWSRESCVALFKDVRSVLQAEAERLTLRPRELACTALLAVVGPVDAAFAQVGDGAIVFGVGHDYRVAFWPDPAEYANATDFLTDDLLENVITFEKVDGKILEVAALTDGLQRLALDFSTRTPHSGFFGPLFNELRTASNPESLSEPFRSFLDSSRVNERTDDDKTLVIAVRNS